MKSDDAYLVNKILRPGKPCTKKYLREYGSDLVCIQHRYCKSKGEKHITVELVIAGKNCFEDSDRIPTNKLIDIRVSLNKKHLRNMIRNV